MDPYIYLCEQCGGQDRDRVIAIMEARAKELVYWDDKYRELTDRLLVTTFGDSGPEAGRVSDVIAKLIADGDAVAHSMRMLCLI